MGTYKMNDLSPVYDEEFKFDDLPGLKGMTLDIEVWNKCADKDKKLGEADVELDKDLLVDRGVHWDFLNDGFRDGNLGGSKAIRVGTIGIGVSSIGSIRESISQGDGGSGGLISRPFPSGLSGDEAWDRVSKAVFATSFDELRLEALYFNFDF